MASQQNSVLSSNKSDLRQYLTETDRKEIADHFGLNTKSVSYILRGDWNNPDVMKAAIEKVRAKGGALIDIADQAELNLMVEDQRPK